MIILVTGLDLRRRRTRHEVLHICMARAVAQRLAVALTVALTSSWFCSMTEHTTAAAELKLERRKAAGSRSSTTASTLQRAAVACTATQDITLDC